MVYELRAVSKCAVDFFSKFGHDGGHLKRSAGIPARPSALTDEMSIMEVIELRIVLTHFLSCWALSWLIYPFDDLEVEHTLSGLGQ